MLMWLILVVPGAWGKLLKDDTLARRNINRFRIGHPDNTYCWARHGVDGFFSVIDAHNHFRPFGGPPVDFDMYIDWMLNHGLLFSTMFGIGQLLVKSNPTDPDCCYYLHCPTFNYTVTPDDTNDRQNAIDLLKFQESDKKDKIHLKLSATFANLQRPENNTKTLYKLEKDYQNMFGWAGEINVFKHALAANGFFNQPRVTVKMLKEGRLDSFFKRLTEKKWPTTLHCDLGCDNYDSVPLKYEPRNRLKGCEVPTEEILLAKNDFNWWRNMLGDFYYSFFDRSNLPRSTFSKIQHLQVWDTLLKRYPDLVVVWAHLGLSKELKNLHPHIHVYILQKLFDMHPNLHADVSWDVLAKQNLMNYESEEVGKLHPENHTDFNQDVSFLFNSTEVDEMRNDLHETWEVHEEVVKSRGSVSGPTHSMAIYLEMFHDYPDRFLTGTDFVASMGPKDDYPGSLQKNGCMKDEKNHARQMTDTSSINMFLEDEAFIKIVLGANYFRVTGLDAEFQPPPLCGDSVISNNALIGIAVGVVGLFILLVVVIVGVVLLCKKSDNSANFTRVGENRSATTNV